MKQNLLTRSILTLVMLVMSVSAWADDLHVTVDGIRYVLNEEDHTAGVFTFDQFRSEVEIPSVINHNGTDYPVVEVGTMAFRNYKIEKIKLPNTVTTIEFEAFRYCENLVSIDLGGSVQKIGFSAFSGCTSLTSVTGYESIDSIAPGGFYNVPWVDNQPDGVVYIGKTLYKYNGAMPSNTSITVKDGTTQICRQAFRDYTNLTAVTLPNSLRTISAMAFSGCKNLVSLSIPPSVHSIGGGAFSDNLWFDELPDGVVYFNDILYCYKGKMPANTSITVKNGTTQIGTTAFYSQEGLASIILPNSLNRIGESAFKYCKKLKSINIPSNVTIIEDCAFQKSGLVSITIPNSVSVLDWNTFEGCSNLETVVLPQSIRNINLEAFFNCKNIKTITCLSETVPNVNKLPFNYKENVTLYVPASALEAYKSDEQWRKFGTIKTIEEMEDTVAPTLSRSQVHVSSTTYSSVTLTWIKATDNFTSKEALKYSVYVGGQLFCQGYDMASCVVTDLKPSTSYTFQVSVEDIRGNVTKYDGARATTEAKPVVIEKYPVFIEYTQITSENATDFWGDGGSIKYDPATKTLTLAWADLSSDDDAISIYDDITIKLIGQNTVKGSIYADYTGELTFAGEGSINVKGEYPLYGWLSALVLKDGCTVELDATGYDSPGLGLDDCLLGVDHSTLKVKGGKGNRSIRAVTSFWMEGSEFESNHSYDKANYMFLDATGKEATDEIIIAPIIKKIPMIEDNSITIVDVDDTSATVAWMAATDDTTPQSELTYSIYSMKYGNSDFTGDAHQKGMTSYTYTNLQPGTTYYVSVKVVDKDGNQVFYQDASFTTTTPDTSAPALSDDEIRVTDVTDNSIAIEWTKATDDRTAGEQLVYEVVYADNNSFADNYLMVLTDKNTAMLRKLTPSTTYYVKIKVSDEASNQSEYRMLSVKTAPPSAINEVTTESGDDKMYSTSGIRVDKNFRGVVIKNGKKYFNK